MMTRSSLLFHDAAAPISSPTADTIRPPPLSVTATYFLALAGVFGAYLVAAAAGLAVPFTNGHVSPLWPAAGVALAAVLRVGLRVWPAIAAAAFLVNHLAGASAPAALAIAAGNTLGPLAGAWLVRRLPRFGLSLSRLDDVLGLIGVAVPASAAISATIGVTALFMAGADPWGRPGAAWVVWWLGDATGALLVAPLALTVPGPRTAYRRRPEVLALCVATVATCVVVFGPWPALGIAKDVFAFVALPVVLWGASRFAIPGAAGATALVACVAVWATAQDAGPFSRSGPLQSAIMLQAYVAVLAAWGLVVATAMADRRHLIRARAHREGVEQNERRFRPIVETAHEGIWMLDADLVTVFANQRMATMLGYDIDELLGRPLADLVSGPALIEAQERLRKGGATEAEHERVQYRRKDGTELWADVYRTRGLAADGTCTGVLKMVSDMSAQRLAEAERQDALGQVALLSQAVEQTADSVLISDAAGRVEYVNPAFEATTGFTRAEALGHTPRLLKSGCHPKEFYAAMWRRLLAGEPYRGSLINRKKSGELYWANETITPIKNGHGNVTHFVAVLNDVTDVRRFHEQEVQLQLARTVQERFNPVAPGIRGLDLAGISHSAAETGGDYYDFIAGPRGILYIAVGDVSGHGFDAALIMALTRSYVRAFAALDMEVGEVLHQVNRAIIGDLEPERYVTMLLVRLDVEAATMTYTSAGHIPGTLLGRPAEADWILDSTGVPLGLFANARFPSRQRRFEPGQMLVLGTDGASETADADGQEFGDHGVLDYARRHASDTAQEIAAGVCRAARAFGAADEQRDDITSVIVKITGPGGGEGQAF